jgi:Pectinacetylesterase
MDTNTRALVARALVLVALAIAIAACGGDAGNAAAPTTQTQSGQATLGGRGWERIRPGGECRCSDGSQYSFWMRRASPVKVLLYLQGGGACFSPRTCAPDRGLYDPTVSTEDDDPAGQSGIFDFADRRNPFADYSVVYVPYCTADVHLGDAVTTYTAGLTVHHKGYANGTAALAKLVATFPNATDVVVAGESAGSVAAPLYGGLVADRLPAAKVTVLADGSGTYPDTPRFNEILAAWGIGHVVPSWARHARGVDGRLSIPGLFIASGRQFPQIVFARHDYAYDAEQARWYPLAGIPRGDLLSRLDRNEAQIERAGVQVLSYVAPGQEHTVLTDEPFYREQVNGRRFVDWVTRLIGGKPVDDVRCRKCRGG